MEDLLVQHVRALKTAVPVARPVISFVIATGTNPLNEAAPERTNEWQAPQLTLHNAVHSN